MKKDTPAVKRAAATGVKMCAVLLIAICLGTVLLYAAYLLPTASMSGHLEESIPVFQAEGSYPRQASWCSSTLDNFTDALLLLTPAYDGGEPTMDKAMNLYFRTVETTPDFNPVNSVLSCGSENMELAMRTYTRYWEGYLIFLKPLLSVMNYQQIRILNKIFQFPRSFYIGIASTDCERPVPDLFGRVLFVGGRFVYPDPELGKMEKLRKALVLFLHPGHLDQLPRFPHLSAGQLWDSCMPVRLFKRREQFLAFFESLCLFGARLGGWICGYVGGEMGMRLNFYI